MYYRKEHHNHEQTLVLLHSGGMAGVEWQPQIVPLTAQFNLLIPDLPGHGQSLLADGQSLSVALMAQAVLTMLAKEQLQKVHLLGSSMGGAVALRLAIHHPEMIDKLIIYRIGYSKDQATYAQTRLMADPEYWRRYGLHAWLSRLHTPQGGEDAWETVIANVSRVLNPDDSEHNHSLTDLANISAETLLIAGDRDLLVPLSTLAAMYEAIPRAALWVMPNASHITATRTWRAKAFAEEVIRFLR